MASPCVQRSFSQLVVCAMFVGTGELVEVVVVGAVEVVLGEEVVVAATVEVVVEAMVEDVAVDDVGTTVPAPAILI